MNTLLKKSVLPANPPGEKAKMASPIIITSPAHVFQMKCNEVK
jgi:hypothetical protein